GRLSVQGGAVGAVLYVDGRRAADLPAAPLPLGVGTHAVRVSHPAYRDVLRFVDIEFDRTSTIDANPLALPVVEGELRAHGADGGARPAGSGTPWYRRWWAVSAMGAVVLGASCAIVAASVGEDADLRARVGSR